MTPVWSPFCDNTKNSSLCRCKRSLFLRKKWLPWNGKKISNIHIPIVLHVRIKWFPPKQWINILEKLFECLNSWFLILDSLAPCFFNPHALILCNQKWCLPPWKFYFKLQSKECTWTEWWGISFFSKLQDLFQCDQ